MVKYSDRNLIINYLPQMMRDEELNGLFSKMGRVSTHKIMRDKGTGYSYGFAFVKYENPADAQRAIDTYNGYRIGDKRLKVAFARVPGEETKNCNIQIENLPPFVDELTLEKFSREFGTVLHARVVEGKGIAFVLFETNSSAEKAIDFMNGTYLPFPGLLIDKTKQKPVKVRLADDNSKKVRPPPKDIRYNGDTVSTAGIKLNGAGTGYWSVPTVREPLSAPAQSMRTFTQPLFSDNNNSFYLPSPSCLPDAGGPMHVRNQYSYSNEARHIALHNVAYPVQRSPSSWQSYEPNGFGVTYHGSYNASLPRDAVHPPPVAPAGAYGHLLPTTSQVGNFSAFPMNGGALMRPTPFPAPAGQQCTLYAYNVGHIPKEKLMQMFSAFGTVMNIEIPWNDAKKKLQNYAFITFASQTDALNAVREMNGFNWSGKVLQVTLRC